MNVLRLSRDYYNLAFFIRARELSPDKAGAIRLTMYPGEPDDIGSEDAVLLRRRLDALAAEDDSRAAASSRSAGGAGVNCDPVTGKPLGPPGDQAE